MTKILIIEDNIDIGQLEQDYLLAHGYEVEICTDGLEGKNRALAETFDLIIVDVMLPSMDGFSVCKHIREVKDIPILFVSAKQDDIDKIRGLGLGADDYIMKPFSPSELVARVGAHLSRYERLLGHRVPDAKDELEAGNVKVIISSMQVFLQKQPIYFKKKEFELLVFLMQHTNHVFAKEELFHKIWGFDAIGDLATVAVHINRIRDKLQDSEYTYIETLWGAGYRFNLQKK